MIRFTLVFIGIAMVSNIVSANENISIEKIYSMAQNVLTATEKWQQDIGVYSLEGRKSKFFPFGLLPFHALWGFGGLNALAVLFVVKFKLIIIASVIAFSVYYYTKFIALKKCTNSHYRETVSPPESSYSGSTFYSRPIVAYSSPITTDEMSHSVLPFNYYDVNGHSDTKTYTYNQELNDYHDLDHSSDFEHFSTDHSSPYYTAPEGNDTKDSGKKSPIMISAMYSNNRRKRARELQTERNFFEQYRYLDETNLRPQTFSDCAKVFDDCEDAERYNDMNVDNNEEDQHL